MSWNAVLGIISTLALFTPVVIVIVERMYRYKSFLALLIYYSLAVIYNLMSENIIPLPAHVVSKSGIINNLLDTPLILLFLISFCGSDLMIRRIQASIIIFIVYELVIITIMGLTVETSTYVLGPGILLTLVFSSYLLLRYIRTAILHSKARGKAMMLAAVLFSYGCFSLIYLFYYILKTPYVEDSFLVYFLVTILSSTLMSSGLLIERNRIQKLDELKTTRKELNEFFSPDANKTAKHA